MARELTQPKKQRGRPRTGVGAPIHVRMKPDQVEAVDAWAAEQPDNPSRAEAIRRLVEMALEL